jgi:hypothetical protein
MSTSESTGHTTFPWCRRAARIQTAATLPEHPFTAALAASAAAALRASCRALYASASARMNVCFHPSTSFLVATISCSTNVLGSSIASGMNLKCMQGVTPHEACPCARKQNTCCSTLAPCACIQPLQQSHNYRDRLLICYTGHMWTGGFRIAGPPAKAAEQPPALLPNPIHHRRCSRPQALKISAKI